MNCHVCNGHMIEGEGGFLMDSENDREYPLCSKDLNKLSYHMLNMLHESLNEKAKANTKKK